MPIVYYIFVLPCDGTPHIRAIRCEPDRHTDLHLPPGGGCPSPERPTDGSPVVDYAFRAEVNAGRGVKGLGDFPPAASLVDKRDDAGVEECRWEQQAAEVRGVSGGPRGGRPWG